MTRNAIVNYKFTDVISKLCLNSTFGTIVDSSAEIAIDNKTTEELWSQNRNIQSSVISSKNQISRTGNWCDRAERCQVTTASRQQP